jgi:hypothetical protein
VEKWFGRGAALRARVARFGYSRQGRCRYVCVEAIRASGVLAIFFFRHADGSWCVFPPESRGPMMNLAPLEGISHGGPRVSIERSAEHSVQAVA